MYRRASVLLGCSAWLLIVAANATVSLGDSYSNYLLGLNPNIYYRLDEAPITAGTTMADNLGIGGASLDATYKVFDGSSVTTTGASGGVIAGNAGIAVTGLAVNLPDNSMASGLTPFSISLWAKPDSFSLGDYGTMFSYGDGASPYYTSLLINKDGWGGAGKINIGAYYQDLFISQRAMTAGQWNSVGLTYSGTELRLFINGHFDSAYSGSNLPATGFKNVNSWLGGLYTGESQKFAGGLDEFAYWNGTKLSDAQMEKLGYANYAFRVKSLNPAGYYRRNETTIGTVYDSSGYGRNAVHTGSPSLNQTPGALAPSESDSAIGGTGAVVDFSSVASTLFATGNDPFSFSMWVKPNGFSAQPWGTMFSYGSVGTGTALIVAEHGILKDGTIDIGSYGHPLFSSLGKLVDQKWNQVGMTYDGSTLSLYLNGKLDNSITSCTLTTGSGSGLLGGLIGGGQPYNGQIDEFAYFRTALSAADMADLASVPEPSTVVLLAAGLIGLLAYAWRGTHRCRRVADSPSAVTW